MKESAFEMALALQKWEGQERDLQCKPGLKLTRLYNMSEKSKLPE